MQKLDLKKLYRYDEKDKVFNIDITIDFYGDLYNEWDFSPDIRRDIDEDLVEFLVGCSKEIGLRKQVVINFFMPAELRNTDKEEKSKKGLTNYFTYIIRKKRIEVINLLKNTVIYLITGVSLLIAAFFVQDYLPNEFLLEIIPEGLLIGAWVLFWEIFSTLFFQFSVKYKDMQHFKRLMDSKVEYLYISEKR